MTNAILDQDFRREALTSIKNESNIVFVSYAVINDTEEKIKFVLGKILEKYNKVEIFTPILSCIKEMLANAIKANAKYILISEGKITNPDNPAEVVKQVRSILNEEALLEYGMKCKMKNLSSRLYLKIQNQNLIIEIINNLPLSVKEQKKISEKIESSSKYDNIAEFFMENPDPEAEGMGLGLSMVVILLKNINISHKNFIVISDGVEKTYARIIIPLR
jgi:hypothetical protein